jgi:hypothetical protein
MSTPRRTKAAGLPWAMLVAMLFLASADVSLVRGEDVVAEAAADSESATEKKQESAEEREKREKAVGKALAALTGIVIVGLSLMGLIWFWGHRVRRTARAPLPEQSPDDLLWYLKNKGPVKADAITSETAESSTDSEADEP